MIQFKYELIIPETEAFLVLYILKICLNQLLPKLPGIWMRDLEAKLCELITGDLVGCGTGAMVTEQLESRK